MMPVMLQPSMAEHLSELWAALHRQAPIMVADCEVHYLTSIAVALDDDLLSQLLLKKLRLATICGAASLPANVVRMNSYLEFAFDGDEPRFCQLLHPSSASIPQYGLSIASLAGAGLIGLQSGQRILWPGEDGKMHDLMVAEVANCPGLDRWLRRDPDHRPRGTPLPVPLAVSSLESSS
jgi:regulator of nucleoside diphosphate kinase